MLFQSKTVHGHNSGESLKWAPKVHGLSILISQAKGQREQRIAAKSEMLVNYCQSVENALVFLFTYLT